IRRCRFGIRANTGHMDESLDAGFSGEPRYPSGSCDVDGIEGLLAAFYIETYGIHDPLDARHRSGNRASIIDVGMGRLNPAVNVKKDCCSTFWMPRCDPHRKITPKQMLDDAPAEKAS